MEPLDAAHGESVEASVFTPRQFDLASRLRLLCIGPRQPSWVNLTLQLDAEGCHEPQFRWVSNGREALAVLRDQGFDCVLIDGVASASRLSRPIEPETEPDVVSLVQSIRGGGCDDPLVLVTAQLDEAAWGEMLRHDCEILVTPHRWESRALVAVIRRALERTELRRENHRLSVGNHRRLVRERDEAEHLLSQQRQILGELSRLSGSLADQPDEPPPKVFGNGPEGQGEAAEEPSWKRFSSEIADFYHELLRAYVIMGSGGLGEEISKLAELIAFTGLGPREAMQLHLERVETLVRGLGSRSSRHVMARADLMALELMIHLGECYQKQSVSRNDLPRQ